MDNITYIWSASDLCFFPSDMAGDYQQAGWDLTCGIDVSSETFMAFSVPPEGKLLGAGPDNMPCWMDIPPPDREERIAEAVLKQQRLMVECNEVINSQQWPSKLALGRLSEAEKVQFNACLDYLDALSAVDTGSESNIDWPTLPEDLPLR